MKLADFELLLHDTLKKCSETNNPFGDMDKSDCDALLQEDLHIADYYPATHGKRQRNGCFGYPVSPLYRNIASIFHEWMSSKFCPVKNLPYFESFDDNNYMSQFSVIEKEVFELLQGLDSLWDLWNWEEKIFRMGSVLSILKRRGILTLLGIRKTCGSVDLWPPCLSTLISSFDTPVSSASALSEGARAISKHYIRDNTLQFWGQCKGNDAQKTSEAKQKLLELINTAIWINVHELPGHIPVIEIRQENGYGARWLADGSSFRGLLEPHMVDGHAVGWKH